MSPYRLKRTEDTDDAIRRVARERADEAVELLRDHDADPVEAVHEARKDVKKLRAVLRLARPSLGKTYRRENDRYRDAALELSDARDAQVRAATIEALADRFADDPPAGGWAALQDAVAGSPPDQRQLKRARERAAGQIMEGEEAIDSWPINGDGFALVEGGLRRAYARGRTRFRAARAEPSDEVLHDWRKRSKDLWYQLRLLCEAWPGVLQATADEAHELADRLGDDHDLAILGDYLHERPGVAAPPQLEHLRKLIAVRRDELQSEAYAYGERLYAEKPKRFVARIRLYWQAGQL